MSYNAPQCGSPNTTTYEMAHLSGSHSGYSDGTAIDPHGITGSTSGHYTAQSQLAAQTAPPALPVFGCGTLLWLLLGSMMIGTAVMIIAARWSYGAYAIWSYPAVFIGGFILIERDRRRRMPGYHDQLTEWSRGMICRRCGYRWFR